MTFDLAQLDPTTRAEEGVEMRIIHPRTGQPVFADDGKTPATITLRGQRSETFRDALTRIQRRNAGLDNQGVVLGPDQLQTQRDQENTEFLVACTVAWNGLSLDGKPFEYSPENVRRLWTDRRFVIVREQALAFIMRDGNFLADTSRRLPAGLVTSSS